MSKPSTELKSLVKEFIVHEESDEYLKAKKIVEAQEKRLKKIKALMKEDEIHEVNFDEGVARFFLEFKVSTTRRVNTAEMPAALKQQYETEIEVWRRGSCRTFVNLSALNK